MKVSVVSKRRSLCAEGPFWNEKEQFLWHVDVHGKAVCRLDPVTQETEHQSLDDYCTMLVPYSSDPNRLLLSESSRLLSKSWTREGKTYLAEIEGTDLRLNDGKCDASGRIWTGSMGLEGSSKYLTVDQAALYSYDENSGQLRTHLKDIGLSNGLGWTKDNRIMFYVDSLARNVVAFDFDLQEGEIGKKRVVHSFNEDDGLPDGMCTDEEDKIWVACFDGAKVVRIDPAVGVRTETISCPAAKITSCCFGGSNYETLFVTSACYGEEKRSETGGAVFQVTGLGVKGLPPNTFGGAKA